MKFNLMPTQVLDDESGKLHLYTVGLWTLCRTWRCGTTSEPRKRSKSRKDEPRAIFMTSYDTIGLMSHKPHLVCQLCFNEANAMRFRDSSSGLVVIETYTDMMLAVLESSSVLSGSDDDSCLSDHSVVSADSEGE